jgi:hypothetical protein
MQIVNSVFLAGKSSGDKSKAREKPPVLRAFPFEKRGSREDVASKNYGAHSFLLL